MKTTARTLRPQDLTSNQRQRWHTLLAQQATPSAFLSPAFSETANRIWPQVHITQFEQNNEIQAFFPWQHTHALLAAAGPVGAHLTDYFGLIAEPSFRITPTELLRASGVASLYFTHLDDNQAAHGLSGEKPTPGLRIRATQAETFLSELHERDRKFSQDTQRRKNKLEREKGPLRFSIETANSDTLDWLIDQKIQQYQRTAQSSPPFSDPRERAFLHALNQLTDPYCQPRLTALYCGETRIAAHFGLQCQDTLAYWFPVYATDFHSYSPGRLLLWETLNAAPQLGLRCIDRGQGDSQAKRDFATEQHNFLRGAWLSNTPKAWLEKGRQALLWRLQTKQAKQNDQ